MMERWVQGVWLGKRFTTDDHIIGLENGKVVWTRNVRPKSLEDTWSFEEIDKIKGQPWDPSVTLTYEKLAQETFPRIEEPTPAEEDYVYMPRSHMITQADLTEAGGWTPGCRKCKAMKEGDHSRTNLAHSADCRARVAEILADDISFRTKMRKAVGRKEGTRRTMEPLPKVQVGGSTSSGCAPVGLTAHPSPQSDDVVMDSADIEIPLSSSANAPIPPPISVTGTKRCRDDEDLEEEQVATVPAITSVGLKRGRSDSSSSSCSSSSSTSEQEGQKIDGEGDAVMHMKSFPEQHSTKEYKLSISTKEEKRDEQMKTRCDKPASGNREHVHEKDRRVQSVYDVAEIFSPPRVCRRARIRGLRGGWSLDDSGMCPVTGKTWDLLNSQEQKKSLEFVLQDQVACSVASALGTRKKLRWR